MADNFRCIGWAASLGKFVPAAARLFAMLPLVDHHNKPHHPITEVFIANFGAQSQVFSGEFLGRRQAGLHLTMHGSHALYDPKSACFPGRAADKFLAFAVRQNRIPRPAQKPGLRSAGRHRALYNPKSDCFCWSRR